MAAKIRGVDPKALLERYKHYSPEQIRILGEGALSLLAILSMPKHLMMQASSHESLDKGEMFGNG